MVKKGQMLVGGILVIIVAVIFLSIIWQFYQGSSGTLQKKDDSTVATSYLTFYALDYTPAGATTCKCANGSAMTVDTHYSLTDNTIKYWGNTSDDRCQINTTGSVNVLCNYDYYSTLYVNRSLTRTVLSYVCVGLIIALLIAAFYVYRREGE